MICSKCRTKLTDNYNVCPVCGFDLNDQTEQSEFKPAQTQTQTQNQTQITPEGYKKVWVLIVLSIVTLGIYQFIWIYRTVGLLNTKLPDGQQFGKGAQVALCLFVPFYIIYWVYKQSKRIEEYGERHGAVDSDLAVLCLILTIVGLGIISYALMQDHINKTILIEANGEDPYKAKCAANAAGDTCIPTQVEAPGAAEYNSNTNAAADPYEELKKLKELYDMGILTEEEFNEKKAKFVNNI